MRRGDTFLEAVGDALGNYRSLAKNSAAAHYSHGLAACDPAAVPTPSEKRVAYHFLARLEKKFDCIRKRKKPQDKRLSPHNRVLCERRISER